VAQRVEVVVTDDVDGSEADETVQFALDGVTYAIDLSEANAEALREVLAPFVEAGRRVGGRASRRSLHAAPAAAPEPAAVTDVSAVRAWAAENGYEVSARGRIPSEIKAAFEAAHA